MAASVPTKLAAGAVFLACVLMAIVNALTTTRVLIPYSYSYYGQRRPLHER